MNFRGKNTLGLIATIAAASLHGKSSYGNNVIFGLPPHPMDEFQSQGRIDRRKKKKGSKPTTRRLKIKTARKANVQRLIKNK